MQQQTDPWFRNHLIRDAIGRALYEQMTVDPSIYLFGEGQHMKVHYDAPQIEREFPERVVTLPISEDGNTNFAVGASLLGVKPVVDVITADFLYRTLDSICNTAAKLNFVAPPDSAPKTIVVRAEFMMGGPTTGQRPEALFTHIPGLNVVVPSTPRDAHALMKTALKTPGVTVFFEDRMILDSETKPEDRYEPGDKYYGTDVHFGEASYRREGGEDAWLTIVTYGLTRQIVEGILDEKRTTGVDLIDLRTLYPVDYETVISSAERTDHLLIVEPDVAYGGVGAEIVATVVEKISPKIIRLGAPRSTIPASRDLHDRMMPSRSEIIHAIKEMTD